MRRSICYCEPTHAYAGEVNTWKFVYTPSSALPKGARLLFNLNTKGRSIDWQLPSTNLKQPSDVIYGLLENGKVVQAKEVVPTGQFLPSYEFILPSELEAGQAFVIVMGVPKDTPVKKAQNLGNMAQTHSQRRRTFSLSVDPAGKGRYEEPENFTMDVRGGPLHFIRVLVPSFVMKNKRFDIVVRFEDIYGNLTNNAPDETLIELSYENIRENLNWKLFVPETGFISLPNLYFNEEGVYTITLYNTHTKQHYKAAPIKCFSENNKHLYWGLLHGESERYDSTENIESCLRHFRDERAYNFVATSSFESQEETTPDTWKLISQNVADFDEAERFATFLGFQWEGVNKEEGLRHMIWAKENKPILRKKDPKYTNLKKIYKSLSPKEMLSIPTFTMGEKYSFNFDDFNPDFERVVEIYNAWGSSECTKKEGNLKPISSLDKSGINEAGEGAIQKALMKNFRFGFVAGGLDDRGIYTDFFDSDQEQYSPGATAIIANELTRSALFEALYNRSCYATTGERIIVGLSLAGVPMGGEINTNEKPGLTVNRHLNGYVAGTCKLKTVEIIRNGTVIKTFEPNDYHIDFSYDDMVALSKVVIDAKDKKPPFVYYYLRVLQSDGHMAWSSPIWVDLLPPQPRAQAKKVAKPVATSSLKKALLEEDEDDEDEDDDLEDDYSDIDEE